MDRRQFADSIETADGKVKRRRRKRVDGNVEAANEATGDVMDEDGRPKRECPVPKPGGLVGHIMGFEKKEKDKPVDVVVRSFRSRNAASEGDEKRP